MGYDSLALTALIVSLVALISTILQVVHQYLSSAADGYRRCKVSVMGPWADETHRHFKWNELRFEVVFKAPVIFLAVPSNTKGPVPDQPIRTIGRLEESTEALVIPLPTEQKTGDIHTIDDERASWVTLLTVIQQEVRQSREWDSREKNKWPPKEHPCPEPVYTIAHQIQNKTRSWDFMPAGITRPYATTALTHLVEMVALLGMHWKTFDVVGGRLTAEGNGCFLTSSLVGGLGLVVTFSITGRSKFEENTVIPSIDIKEWVFGFVPSILGQSLEVRTVEGIQRTLANLKCGPEILSRFQEKKDCSFIPSVTFELVAMLAKPVRIRGSSLKMLPNPTDEKWPGDSSLIDWSRGMSLFQTHITALEASTAGVHELISAISEQWKKIEESWQDASYINRREVIHEGLDMSDNYFGLKNKITITNQEITNIVVSHLSSVIKHSQEIQDAVVAQDDKSTDEFMRIYFDDILPEVVSDVGLSAEDKKNREAIWVCLMFRMICWFLLHDFHKMDINIVPSELMGSRMPVFIN